MSVFEALRAYVESRNVAVTSVNDIIRVARKLTKSNRSMRLVSLQPDERRVVALLWHLGLVASLLKFEEGRASLWVSPTLTLHRVARGELMPLAVRIARWTPMRLLLRYMMLRGGSATVGDVERDLGSEVLRVTRFLSPVLRLAYSRFRPAKKPYNRHVIEAVLFRLGSELGLLRLDGRGRAEVMELAYELAEEARTEVVKTMPSAPLVLAAVASVAACSRRVFISSPWIDSDVAEALLPLLKDKEVVVITRPPRAPRHRRAVEILGRVGEVRAYARLHTKLVLGDPAVVTSANLTRASLLRNLETGIYYRRAPAALRVHAQEIAASAAPLSL